MTHDLFFSHAPVQKSMQIMLDPGTLVEVGLTDLPLALAAASDALPYLRGRSLGRTQARPLNATTRYHLSCLLCSTIADHQPKTPDLVTLQEHLMQSHAFTQEDLREGIRVSHTLQQQVCHVWVLPPVRAKHLHLAHLSYMRAVLFPVTAPTEATTYTTLVCTHPFDLSQARRQVEVVEQDDLAWYGYLRGEARSGPAWVWPTKAWKTEEEV